VEPIQYIQEFEHLKILADARRLVILRMLMAKAATLSQLGEALGEHPARVRHHLKQLESAGLVELVETRIVRGFVEKYYRARARAFMLQEMILPDSAGKDVIAILGSHDLALEALTSHIDNDERIPLDLLVLPIGSLEGLIALRQGSAQLAGCHLLDVDSGEYNLPYVRHIFPDKDVSLVTLAHRQQGLLTAPGNPLQLNGLEDLARQDVTLVNRNRGSGTRLWLDRQLEQISLPEDAVRGYDHEVRTHNAVAEEILGGDADAGIGLEAAALQSGLGFIPLFQERFDLVVPGDQIENERLQPLFDLLTSAKFRRLATDLGGYSTSSSGDLLNP